MTAMLLVVALGACGRATEPPPGAPAAAFVPPSSNASPPDAASHHADTLPGGPMADPAAAPGLPDGPERAVAAAVADPDRAAPPRYREVTVPAGTTLRLTLDGGVSSQASRVEDAVHATLRQPVVIDGVTVLPAGTPVSGVVVDARRSGRVKGRARVALRFTDLRVDGERYTIGTNTIARVAPATRGADAAKIGIGAGAGAVVGALTGGRRGAAIGTAVGAAGGTGVVLATRGREVQIPRGATVAARLSRPVTIRVQ